MIMVMPQWNAPTSGGIQFGGIPGTVGNQAGWLGDVGQTFVGDPSGLWQAGRLAQLSQAQAANPQWTNQAMTGFTPTYGQYLLGGAPGTFGEYLGARAAPTGNMYTSTPATMETGTNWEQAVKASGMLGAGIAGANTMTPQQFTYAGLLQGENARRNALAMTGAAMGGGIGMGAMARQRALGNLYDVYAARQAGAGDPQGGFINWINDRMNLAAPAVTTQTPPPNFVPEPPFDVDL
jgi:hypothetical protein